MPRVLAGFRVGAHCGVGFRIQAIVGGIAAHNSVGECACMNSLAVSGGVAT